MKKYRVWLKDRNYEIVEGIPTIINGDLYFHEDLLQNNIIIIYSKYLWLECKLMDK